MSHARSPIDAIAERYSPEVFRRAADAVVGELASYLEASRGERRAVLPRDVVPEALIARMGERLREGERAAARGPEEIASRLRGLVQEVISWSGHFHSPQYIGHQLTPPVPIAGTLALTSQVLNPGMAIFEGSPGGTALERALIARLAEFLPGWNDCDGIVTGGGSLANLTALLAARNAAFPDAWSAGLGAARPAILASADSHYSISRAAGVLGLGAEQVVAVGLDARRRIDPEALAPALRRARERGLEPFCLVGSACATPIGAFDPLEDLGRFAREHGLWFHVDAAHGGGFLLSERLRGLLRGAELADSLIWDAHKMMFMPSLCTFVLYRERARSFLPFRQEASYIFSPESALLLDGGLRTLECTKSSLALPTWALWSLFGPEVFAGLAERMVETTRAFHALLEASPDFEPLHEPECNILCFRHVPERLRDAPPERLSELQRTIREALVRDGEFYITGTRLDGAYALRVTVMNPFTGLAELEALLARIRGLAAAQLSP